MAAEELTSGASGRIIPLFKRAKTTLFVVVPSYQILKQTLVLFYTFFLYFLLLLVSRSRDRDGGTETAVKRKRRWKVEEEEDTLRRRVLAQQLKMVVGGDDDVDDDVEERENSGENTGSGCKWRTWVFFGGRGNGLFCRSWFPLYDDHLKGIIIIIHGLNEHGGRYSHFAKQLTSSNFGVYAMDWIGHGGSDGLHGFVPSLDHVVADTAAFLEKIKLEHPEIPCFLFGHSTGGAVVLKAASYPHIERIVEGVILTSPALRVKPAHPVVGVVAPIFSLVAPRFQFKGANKRGIAVSRDPAQLLAKYSDPLVYTGPIRVRTGHEILRITSYLTRNFKRVTVPFFVLHGTADRVTDPLASRDLYNEAPSKFKDIRLYDGFLHDLLFEPEREEIGQDIIDWMEKCVAKSFYSDKIVD